MNYSITICPNWSKCKPNLDYVVNLMDSKDHFGQIFNNNLYFKWMAFAIWVIIMAIILDWIETQFTVILNLLFINHFCQMGLEYNFDSLKQSCWYFINMDYQLRFAQNITRLLGFKDKFIIIFGCFGSNPGLGELLMNYLIHYS